MQTFRSKNGRALVLLGLALALPAAAATNDPAPTVPELVAVLRSNATRKEKADACRELARVGTPDAVPALAALLGDEELSHMARYGLETIPSPAVDDALRDALSKLHGRPLVGVIGSIGFRRDAKAVKPLARLLDDSDPDVAQGAARALGRIGNASAARELGKRLTAEPGPNQVAFCEGLFRCAESLDQSGNPKEAFAAYERLRRLKSAPHQVRAGALRGLIVREPKQAPALIRQSLRQEDFVLADAAIRAAYELPGKEITQALVADFKELAADKQVLVLQALARRDDGAVLPTITAAARNGPQPVRIAALRALGERQQGSAAPALIALVKDPDAQVAETAQESLAGIPGREVDAAVVSMLNSRDAGERLTGLELVGRRRMSGELPALVKATADPDSKVRVAAFKRVGELGTPAEVPALIDLLGRASAGEDRDAAEQALGAIAGRAENPSAVNARLIRALGPAPAAPKAALLRVLSVVGGDDALQAVRSAVSDPDPEIHGAALRALGTWKTADAAPELLALAQGAGNATDKTVALRGYFGWASHEDLPADRRLEMCRSALSLVGQPEEKKLLLGALGGIGTTEALALIVPFLDDSSVREEAAIATVTTADELLKGDQASRVAPQLIAPLQKAAQGSANNALQRRAQSLLRRAQAK